MILLLGGTEDSRLLGKVLQEGGYNVTVSVVTEYGKELALETGMNSVIAGPLTEEKFARVITTSNISTVIDATHPFAINITAIAAKTCHSLGVSYIRYERKDTPSFPHRLLQTAATFAEGINTAARLAGPWFFTTGSRQLALVLDAKLFSLDQLFVRVLPDPGVLQHCYELGLRARNIIAIQGPISYEMNLVTYRDLGIKTIITKDSGTIGGTPEKIKAGLDLNLNVVVIKRPRPAMLQPMVVRSPAELVQILERSK